MDISQLPFNQLIGLELASPDSDLLISLPAGVQYTNHLGTVHGSALLAVAEAGSGVFLMQQFGDSAGFIPVVRKLEAKLRKPASGRVSARSVVKPDEISHWASELATRERLSAVIPMEIVDEGGVVVMSAVVEWFIAKTGK